ncbi:class I SAM-dependent RNA methyltransferase [Lachnospiraceae bacterium 47-T17]
MKKGQIYEGTVEKVSFPNKCTVAVEGEERKVIMKHALPGQRVRFRLSKVRKGKCEGNLLEVLEPSQVELCGADIPCVHFGACGGCTYQHLRYEDQLALKETQIRELLAPVLAAAGSDFDALFEGILPSPRQFGYRNKMEFSFGDTCKDGDLALGMHKRGSFYDIVTVSDCQIVDADFRKILSASLAYFSQRRVSYFHKNTHEGYLRHLLVRKAARTGEILVDLVTTTQLDVHDGCVEGWIGCPEEQLRDADGEPDLVAIAFQSAEARIRGASFYEEKLLAGFSDVLKGLELDGHIAGILHTHNDSVADVVKDEGTDILFGEDFFYEELLGLRFKISPFSFFQTNSLGAEVLYETARGYVGDLRCAGADSLSGAEQHASHAPDDGSDSNSSEGDCGAVVYDLYSGTGTIAQMLAPVAGKVIGVEIVEEAVEAAKENAALNGLSNCEFLAGDVLKVLDSIAEKPDFIVLDPPRDGIHPKALEKIVGYGVARMVYISCKPTSLARDLEVLQGKGYRVERVRCVDMFPGTVHTECAVLIQRKYI